MNLYGTRMTDQCTRQFESHEYLIYVGYVMGCSDHQNWNTCNFLTFCT
jgi:hypothetical protein